MSVVAEYGGSLQSGDPAAMPTPPRHLTRAIRRFVDLRSAGRRSFALEQRNPPPGGEPPPQGGREPVHARAADDGRHDEESRESVCDVDTLGGARLVIEF